MKRYVLFAGCNGAGKSTLYQTNEQFRDMPRVNLDEILREFGSWKNEKEVFEAGKIAVRRIGEYFASGTSFNQETTLCGKSIWNNIDKARNLGYWIEMHYVGVDSAETAKKRIAFRVSRGGHGISDEDVERRFSESIANLSRAISLCDVVEVYDNTEKFQKVACFERGRCVMRAETCPDWVPRS